MWFGRSHSSRRQRRRDSRTEPFPAQWRTVLERRWALWHVLDDDERRRLETRTQAFVADRRWEGAQGFTVTEEMKVLIAAQASLLTIGLDMDAAVDPFTPVSSIIVHPRSMVVRGERSVGPAGGRLTTDGPVTLDGQAHHRGPVLLSWSTLAFEAMHPQRGQNVVLHEFAHRLDMLDGVIDGTPPIPDRGARDRWVAVCTEVYDAVRLGDDRVLRPYAATDPGEFFAVATETFFTLPVQLGEVHPALYEVLSDFYGQNPARWWVATG